jgi:MFS transporter, ACS family, hexuronate transporter
VTGSAAIVPTPVERRRWLICGLLFAAVVLIYIDRQVLSVLKPTLAARYGWTERGYRDVVFWFQAAYGIGYVAFGRFVDRFGARVGYTVAVALWTLGHLAHVLLHARHVAGSNRAGTR